MSNARELSEIGAAVTVDSSKNISVVGSVTTPSLNSNNTFGFKNRIINGDMRIDQRNAGASVTPANGQYVTDRWKYLLTQSSKLTSQQSTVSPSNYTNSLLVTSSSAYSIVSGDALVLQQFIEGLNCTDLGWGTASAKTVTLSFWVRSSLTGTFGGALTNSDINRSYPFSYVINTANTWEQKSVTITGDTSGTWLKDNNTGIRLSFGLGVGSTYSGTAGAWAGSYLLSATGATSVVGTSGATFYITGVQLEVGSSATGFEYRQYGQELQLCQRYYQIGALNMFVYGGSTTVSQQVSYQTQPRTTPTLTRIGGTGANIATDTGFESINLYGARYTVTLNASVGGYYNSSFSASSEL